ncbi:MAG: MlaD family protein [Candidatus Moduliflexus flocculans]|nr:MlaD family protein [Candidatus Moduliflexus flocculans]
MINIRWTPASRKSPPRPSQTRKRRFSLVWVVPVVAALIGGWLVVKALTEKGPEITITFKSAEGLEAGKTKIKFKDVEIGAGRGNPPRQGPVACDCQSAARQGGGALSFQRTPASGWSARGSRPVPSTGWERSSQAPTSMSTPGNRANRPTAFTGLEEPPIVTTGLPGRHFILESERRGSLEVGAPIYYRQIRAGEVVAYNLSEDGTKIISKIFVNAPYHQFVRNNTRFWSASGVDLKLDASGITLDTESLVSILVGGIAFDTIENNSEPGGASPGECNLQTLSEPRSRPTKRFTAPKIILSCSSTNRSGAYRLAHRSNSGESRSDKWSTSNRNSTSK